ncbi:RING/U-box superfamily protein, putative isoform 1 [Hibiscus syriacus]|uniref:pyridoxal 5'-phosphate synthase (glutamine hydrolyzing) n=1 Tax=Hibiscus syriacus TaxID=106335 RepID=A0A6A2ZKZ8_HIBSY|nr:RING/U-box superfamily protein, putative isoform 1 [Hibiscus syriacus]
MKTRFSPSLRNPVSLRFGYADEAAWEVAVVQFAAGGVATPADAALMMQLGCDGVFVGSGVFKSGDPAKRARAIVQAVTHYSDPDVLADVSCGLGEAMVGLNLTDKKARGSQLGPISN